MSIGLHFDVQIRISHCYCKVYNCICQACNKRPRQNTHNKVSDSANAYNCKVYEPIAAIISLGHLGSVR